MNDTDKFRFESCKHCEYCIYDLDERRHKCRYFNAWIDHNVHSLTDCKQWKQG